MAFNKLFLSENSFFIFVQAEKECKEAEEMQKEMGLNSEDSLVAMIKVKLATTPEVITKLLAISISYL